MKEGKGGKKKAKGRKKKITIDKKKGRCTEKTRDQRMKRKWKKNKE